VRVEVRVEVRLEGRLEVRGGSRGEVRRQSRDDTECMWRIGSSAPTTCTHRAAVGARARRQSAEESTRARPLMPLVRGRGRVRVRVRVRVRLTVS